MGKKGKIWALMAALVAVAAAVTVLFFLAFRPAYALEFFFTDTTLLEFNEGFLYHTALAWQNDGEVTLLPIGLGQPWITATALPYPLAGHAAAYDNGRIFVIGGETGIATINDVISATIDPSTHKLSSWQTATSLPSTLYPEGLYFHEAIALDGYIYVLGGSEDAGATSTYYDTVVYSPILPNGQNGSWQATTPLPEALFGMESVVLNGRIYVLGGSGSNGQSRNKVYYATPGPTGEITEWHETSAPLPPLGAGGYFDPAVSVENNRIYVYGGSSGRLAATYSPYVHFATPDPVSGDISSWTLSSENLPQNCYASEGAAYQSGLLLAVAGAWNNAIDPSGDVRASLVDHDTGLPGEWVSTIGLAPPRFYHTVIQDKDGWLYSIGGKTGAVGGHLNEVQVAPPYGGGQSVRAAAGLQHAAADRTIYAPDGTFTSPQTPVSLVEDQEATLTSIAWNTTITNPATMQIAVAYRYHQGDTWSDWFGPFPSLSGISTTTHLDLSGSCDLFQYRAFFTSTISTTTPILHWVRIGVLAPPDLVAEKLTVTGCDGCPGFIPPNQPVQIEFTVRNQSTSLKDDNNFYAMLFVTTIPDFSPYPPALPTGCAGWNPPTVTCPLIWPLQYDAFEDTDPPVVLTATWTFTTPGIYYLVAYVDYNDTPANPPAIYDVVEFNEFNNLLTLAVSVGQRDIFLPLLFKRQQ